MGKVPLLFFLLGKFSHNSLEWQRKPKNFLSHYFLPHWTFRKIDTLVHYKRFILKVCIRFILCFQVQLKIPSKPLGQLLFSYPHSKKFSATKVEKIILKTRLKVSIYLRESNIKPPIIPKLQKKKMKKISELKKFSTS